MYIKRKLNENLTVFKNLRDTNSCVKNSRHRYSVTVGIGGNLGDVKRRIGHLCTYLKKDRRIGVQKRSLILKNPPFGYSGQDDFFNSVIVLGTDMQPGAFLDFLMRIEKRFGRKRSFENAPRTLDLDIIFFDERVVDTKKLQIPHTHWFKRESVLIPLTDIYK